jgi:hypothetical protein
LIIVFLLIGGVRLLLPQIDDAADLGLEKFFRSLNQWIGQRGLLNAAGQGRRPWVRRFALRLRRERPESERERPAVAVPGGSPFLPLH